MTDIVDYPASFKILKTCVVIPTYNNAGTLAAIISDVSKYCCDIIVVNDGSTDDTLKIIESFPAVQQISYQKNVGKGWALRQALDYTTEKGYHYAITIDSDGQHFAKDLPVFLEKLTTTPDTLIIGSRNMDQASVPGKSSFGHWISNTCFKIETGFNCPDTQSGYRLYPLQQLKGMKFYTVKYEFEIEILVRASWRGIKIDAIPVSVYYAPKEIRISHFRPFTDFSRVTVLNTVLIPIALLYIKPRDFFKSLLKKKILEKLLSGNYSIPKSLTS